MENTRPREIVTLCVSLWFLEIARIVTNSLFAFLLADPAQLLFSGYTLSLAFSIAAIIALFGIFKLRWWGVLLFLVLYSVGIICSLFETEIPVFKVLFTILLLCLVIIAILPHKEEFR